MRAPHDATKAIAQGIVNRFRSFFTARCPICRVRYGIRAHPSFREGILKLLRIFVFECRGCNRRFWAFSFESR